MRSAPVEGDLSVGGPDVSNARFPDMLNAGVRRWKRGWISAARITALSSRNYDEKELGLGRLPRRMITPMQIGKPPLGASTLLRARSLATVPGA